MALDSASPSLYAKSMTTPLVALSVFLAAAPAHAVPGAAPQRDHPRLVALRIELGRAFIERPQDRLPDVAARRDELLAAGVPAAQIEALAKAVTEAQAIQGGHPPGTVTSVFEQQIVQAAMGLRIRPPSLAVPVYLNRGADTNLTPDEIAAHQALLEQVRRRQVSPAITAAVTARLAVNARILNTSRDAGWLPAAAGAGGGTTLTPEQIVAPPAATPEQIAARIAESRAPGAQPHQLRGGADVPALPATAPAPTGTTWSFSDVAAYIDNSRIANLARAAAETTFNGLRRIIAFVGSCYQYLKEDFIQAGGFFSSRVRAGNQVGIDGIGSGSAYMFGQMDAAALNRVRMRKVEPDTIPWAGGEDALEGYTIVWGPTCAGFHRTHGHIEYILSRSRIPTLPYTSQLYLRAVLGSDELLVKSDGVTGRSVRTLQRYSTRDPRTRAFPSVQVGRTTVQCLTVLAPVSIPAGS